MKKHECNTNTTPHLKPHIGTDLKNRQYSVKVFETSIKNDDEFIEFMKKYHLLFKDHLIVISGEMSLRSENYLKEAGYHYLHNVNLPTGRSKKALEEEFQLQESKPPQESEALLKAELEKAFEAEKAQLEEHFEGEKALLEEALQASKVDYAILKQELNGLKKRLNTKLTVLDKMIRSGRELHIEGDLLLLNRVNSGASIYTSGNMIITQVVEGALRCDGQFMMVRVSPKANIVFNGVEVDNALLKDTLNRIELTNNEIYITPVIKKEINWEQS